MVKIANEGEVPLETSDSGQPDGIKTWDDAVAAGLLTKEMVEVLVAPDSLTEQISDIARSLEERRRRSRDRG